MAEIAAKRPFGMRDKLGYAFGDLGNDFTFMLTSSFMMAFYTDIMKVEPAIIGILMMAARFIDAFTDVTMGQIVDRSKPTKDGKFKPWIKRMCIPLAVAAFLVFASYFRNMPMGFRVVWMFFTYILWGSICYTAVNIPYGSMASAITNNPDERAQLSTFRSTGATVAQLVIGGVTPMLIYVATDSSTEIDPVRICVVAGVYAICGCICHFICASLCTERVEIPQNTSKFSGGELVSSLLHNRALIGIIIAAIFLLLGMLGMGGMAPYIFPHYFRNRTAQSAVTIIACIANLVICAPLAAKAAKKWGKKETATVGSIVSAAAWIVCFVVRPSYENSNNAWVYVAFYVVSYAALGFFNFIIWAMITDVIDDEEVRLGKREDGKNYSVYSFARKIGQALSSGLIGVFLSAIGYNDAVPKDPLSYPDVLNGIFNIACIVPAVGMILVALALIFIYPLNKKRVDSNAATLKARREGK